MRREPWRFRKLCSSERCRPFRCHQDQPNSYFTVVDLRHLRDEEPAVDTNFREIVGSLMWIASQTRPDISNAVRAIARLSHDPKGRHVKAARKILEYLSATAHFGLTFRRESKLEDVQLEYNLETYVAVRYAHEAEQTFLFGSQLSALSAAILSALSFATTRLDRPASNRSNPCVA